MKTIILKTTLLYLLTLMLTPLTTYANNRAPYVSLSSDYGYSTIVVDRGTEVYFSGYGYDRDYNGTRYLNFTWKLDGVTQKTQYGRNTYFSHTFTPPAGVKEQTYTVKLSGRDNEGSTVTKTMTIIVKGFDRQYYLTDHLGSIRTTVDGSGMNMGSVSSWDDFYPLGLPMPDRSFNYSNPQALNKFTGHEHDVQNSINLTYAEARYLDPEIGQWLSVDPILAERTPRQLIDVETRLISTSPYNYVFGNPINLNDPDGKCPQPLCDDLNRGLFGAVVGGVSAILSGMDVADGMKQGYVQGFTGTTNVSFGAGKVMGKTSLVSADLTISSEGNVKYGAQFGVGKVDDIGSENEKAMASLGGLIEGDVIGTDGILKPPTEVNGSIPIGIGSVDYSNDDNFESFGITFGGVKTFGFTIGVSYSLKKIDN